MPLLMFAPSIHSLMSLLYSLLMAHCPDLSLYISQHGPSPAAETALSSPQQSQAHDLQLGFYSKLQTTLQKISSMIWGMPAYIVQMQDCHLLGSWETQSTTAPENHPGITQRPCDQEGTAMVGIAQGRETQHWGTSEANLACSVFNPCTKQSMSSVFGLSTRN